jgi:hypothetical protein
MPENGVDPMDEGKVHTTFMNRLNDDNTVPISSSPCRTIEVAAGSAQRLRGKAPGGGRRAGRHG